MQVNIAHIDKSRFHIEKTVFISYRRTNASWALLIYNHLTQHGFDVFFDYTGISSGDFESVILENIRARAHFLVILSPSALERCSESGDWLRREIEEAIFSKRNVVPLLFEDFSFSSSAVVAQLTGPLTALKSYNGLRVTVEYFDAAMLKLRTQWLNTPLNAVLHPLSATAQKAAHEQQAAADAKSASTVKPLPTTEQAQPPSSATGGKVSAEILTDTISANQSVSRSDSRFSKRHIKSIAAGAILVIAVAGVSIVLLKGASPRKALLPQPKTLPDQRTFADKKPLAQDVQMSPQLLVSRV